MDQDGGAEGKTHLQELETAEIAAARFQRHLTGACPERSFCTGGEHSTCKESLQRDWRDIEREGGCQMFFWGHARYIDYATIFEANGVLTQNVKYMSFLREPISRAISEYRHITEGITAAHGPNAFGLAWEYGFFHDKKIPFEQRKRLGTLSAWLECAPCRVGSSNRQTRFLAGFDTEPSETDWNGKLQSALRNLERCAFVGLTEKFEDSMLLLKLTFPLALQNFRSYTTKPHALEHRPLHHQALAPVVSRHLHSQQQQQAQQQHALKASEANITVAEMARLKDLNQADVFLYGAAESIFSSRFAEAMQHALGKKIAAADKRFRFTEYVENTKSAAHGEISVTSEKFVLS